MTDDADRRQIKDALVRLIIELSGSETDLDEEDRAVLARYGSGSITKDEMISFFRSKAARIEDQIRRPQ